MRFTAFPETPLNPDIRRIGHCRWAKPTHTHTQEMSLVLRFNRVSEKAVKRI
jgi:hypothetical protein